MKKSCIKLSMIALVILAVLVLFVRCSNPSSEEGNENTYGILTINDIPSIYNGQYAMFSARLNENSALAGYHSYDPITESITLVQIMNSSVSLPLWKVADALPTTKYNGNDTVSGSLQIHDILTFNRFSTPIPLDVISFQAVTFLNGSSTKSWNDANTY